jgi:hypothetical protein
VDQELDLGDFFLDAFLVIRQDFDQIGFSSSFPKGKGLLSGCPA